MISSGSLNTEFVTETLSGALIESHSMGNGHGGNVTINTGPLNMNGSGNGIDTFNWYFIDSGIGGGGNGGNVSITAGDAQIKGGGINTGDNLFGGVGNGGNLTIKANSLLLETVSFATDAFSARAGTFSLETIGDITVRGNSFLSAISLLGENPFTIKAARFVLDDSSNIFNGTALGPGGGVTITASAVEVTNSSQIATQTFGDGDSGSIRVTATDHVTLSGSATPTSIPSLFVTSSTGDVGLGTGGKAGTIEITTPQLTITDGARLNSTTQSSGRGGDVIITAESVTISGQASGFPELFEQFGLGGFSRERNLHSYDW